MKARRPSIATVAAVAWILAAAAIDLAPALAHGTKLGTQDLLASFGFGYIPGVHPHNVVASDQIQEMIPWSALSWKEVHAGHFPLWNPYSGFGMPLFGNFVSASLSLPTLVSYITPERFVYTVEVYVKLVIAGTGVLWMGRKLGLRHLAATFGATVFMLSGSLTAWLGWPMSGTMGWLGWAVGAAVLVVRSERPTRYVAGLAAVLAFVVYAGHPETLVIVVMCTAIVALVTLAGTARSGSVPAAARRLGALAAAGIGALMLAAPLLLPGIQVVGRSARTSVLGYAQPPSAAVGLLFATYHGLPVRGSAWFGPVNFYETSVYVGAVALVLAGLAVVARGRDPVVGAVAAVAVLCALLTYSSSISHLLDQLPVAKNLQWSRAVTALDFSLAALSAFGFQALMGRHRQGATRRVFAGLSALVALVVAGLWVRHLTAHLPSPEAGIQARSFIWPAVSVVALLVAAAVLSYGPRRARGPVWLGAGLLAVESAFLLTATPGIWSSSSQFLPATPAEAQYIRFVGSARVGFASCPSILGMPYVGILAEANDAYGVAETPAYDGTVPKSWFTSYFGLIHQPLPASTGYGQWCPSITDGAVARHFGVGYVLTAAGAPAPPGTTLATTIAGEGLYRVPGGGILTVEPAGAAPDSPNARVVPYTDGDPSTLRATVTATGPSTLYIHETDFPGWKVTVDGHPVPVRTWGGTMLAAPLSPGRHTVMVRYQPATFVAGVVLAAVAAVALAAAVAASELAARRPSPDQPAEQSPQVPTISTV